MRRENWMTDAREQTLHIFGGEVEIGRKTLRDDEVPPWPFLVIGFGDDAIVIPDPFAGDAEDDQDG